MKLLIKNIYCIKKTRLTCMNLILSSANNSKLFETYLVDIECSPWFYVHWYPDKEVHHY